MAYGVSDAVEVPLLELGEFEVGDELLLIDSGTVKTGDGVTYDPLDRLRQGKDPATGSEDLIDTGDDLSALDATRATKLDGVEEGADVTPETVLLIGEDDKVMLPNGSTFDPLDRLSRGKDPATGSEDLIDTGDDLSTLDATRATKLDGIEEGADVTPATALLLTPGGTTTNREGSSTPIPADQIAGELSDFDSASASILQLLNRQPFYYVTSEAELTTALAALSGIDGEVVIAGDVTLTSNLSVPSAITVRFSEIGRLLGSVDLTIGGRVVASPHHIFGSDLNLTLADTGQWVFLEWFGAAGNGTTDDSDAIDAAIAACPRIQLQARSYLGGTHNAVDYLKIRGEGSVSDGSAYLSGSVIKGKLYFASCVGFELTGFGLFNTATDADCLSVRGDSSDFKITDVNTIANNHGFLIESYGGTTEKGTLTRCRSYGGKHGFICKAEKMRYIDCWAYDASQDGWALKSDNLLGAGNHALCEDVQLVDSGAYGCNTGMYIYGLDDTSEDNSDGVEPPKRIRVLGGTFGDSDPSNGVNIGHLGSESGKTYLTPEDISFVGVQFTGNALRALSVRRVDGLNVSGCNFGSNSAGEAFSVDWELSKNIYIDPDDNNWGGQYPGNTAYWQYIDPDATSFTVNRRQKYYQLTQKVTFNSGSEKPNDYSVVVGATSGATGIVVNRNNFTGSWAGGDGAGDLWLIDVVGTFSVGENLNIDGGSSNVATVTARQTAAVYITSITGGLRGQEIFVRCTDKSGLSGDYAALGLQDGFIYGRGAVAHLKVTDQGDEWNEIGRSTAYINQGKITYNASNIDVPFDTRGYWICDLTGDLTDITLLEPRFKTNTAFVLHLDSNGAGRSITGSWSASAAIKWGAAGAPTSVTNGKVLEVVFAFDGVYFRERSRIETDS